MSILEQPYLDTNSHEKTLIKSFGGEIDNEKSRIISSFFQKESSAPIIFVDYHFRGRSFEQNICLSFSWKEF